MSGQEVWAWAFYGGKIKVIKIDGTAATAATNLRPPEGKRWLVIAIVGYHDDSSARSTQWTFTDGTDTSFIRNASSLNASELLPINSTTSVSTVFVQTFPIVLDYDNYAILTVTSIGSGKKGYIRGLVLEVDYT